MPSSCVILSKPSRLSKLTVASIALLLSCAGLPVSCRSIECMPPSGAYCEGVAVVPQKSNHRPACWNTDWLTIVATVSLLSPGILFDKISLPPLPSVVPTLIPVVEFNRVDRLPPRAGYTDNIFDNP